MTIKNTIAINSYKGGVGKSTITCLLAKALSKRGLDVGICDLDIAGPCLKILMDPKEDFARWISKNNANVSYDVDDVDRLCSTNDRESTCSPEENEYLKPLEVDNTKLMSISFFKYPKSQGFTAFRGPVSDQICKVLLKKTDWGELDYLILDLPPGSIDIILSAVQHIAIDGVIAITTPHITSQQITQTGLNLFKYLEIPILALVENMAFFECKCGKNYIFGEPSGQDICKNHDISKYLQLPLLSKESNRNIDIMLKNEAISQELNGLVDYLLDYKWIETKKTPLNPVYKENNFDW